MKKFPKNKGFTLIEVLIYMIIFSMISALIISSYVVVTNSFAQTRSARDLLESGNTSMERMSREIRMAKSIDITNSTVGSSPGILQLNSINGSGGARIVKFTVSSGALNLYQDGNLTANLLGQNISVTSLIFRRISTGAGEAVKTEMILQDNRSQNLHQENFYDTIILRGKY